MKDYEEFILQGVGANDRAKWFNSIRTLNVDSIKYWISKKFDVDTITVKTKETALYIVTGKLIEPTFLMLSSVVRNRKLYLKDRQEILQIMNLLIEAGANVNFVHPESGKSILTEAVANGEPAAVKILVEAGADPNAGVGTMTAIDTAVDYLTANKARDVQNETLKNRLGILKYLLENGGYISAKDPQRFHDIILKIEHHSYPSDIIVPFLNWLIDDYNKNLDKYLKYPNLLPYTIIDKDIMAYRSEISGRKFDL